MRKRPVSVIVIACYLITTAIYSLVKSRTWFRWSERLEGEPDPLLLLSRILAVVVLTAFVMMVFCGIGMLMRQNWARLVYVVAMAGTFIAAATLSPIFPFAMIPHVVIYLVITAFLFTSRANEYFSPSTPADGSQDVEPHLDGDKMRVSRRSFLGRWK
jgi:hypothetical protein